MSLFKVLGGIVIGAGAVAIAPFTGGGSVLVAGITLAKSLAGAEAVAVGAAVIGAAGAVISDMDNDNKINSAYKKGIEQGKSENLSEMENLKSKLKKASKRFKEYKEFENYLLACYAVGISVACCDGDFSDAKKNTLEEFIQGVSFKNYPITFEKTIQILYNNPPTFDEAMTFVKKSNATDLCVFTDIIDIIIASDNVDRYKERKYREDWENFISAYIRSDCNE
ncbi:hypothetical protein OSSY52_19060 [Tepiditoga spiralis]|uniref:Uncharacterized protein n=1 Tax=Tepiditoga spiralis TaxID=2108365 RepID=A0A7G1G6H0_9BACT|nr:hypothetical protein [Tepiditoga spiralis]BBE31765.1 hypothetical protein OSSY52_19060 [Tepiditoga spiralis]